MQRNIFYVILHSKIVLGNLLRYKGEKMTKSKYGLIYIPANHDVATDYEDILKVYLDARDKGVFVNTLPQAWNDPRVGGLRIAIKKRMDSSKNLALDNFRAFQAKRQEEIQQLLSDPTLPAQEVEHLEKELNALTTATDYISFGKAMGVYDTHDQRINIASTSDQKKQVNYTLNYIDPMLQNRFNMMQSISFAVSNGDNLPTGKRSVNDFYNSILQGTKSYLAERDDYSFGFFFSDIFVDKQKEFRKELEFKYITTHVHEAEGLTKTYEDATRAITDSQGFEAMCLYYAQKYKKAALATQNEDEQIKFYALSNAWEKGNYNNIISTLRTYHMVPENDTLDYNNLYCNDIHGTIRDSITVLKKLQKTEDEYNYMSGLVNEFNLERQKNPALIDELQNFNDKNQLIRLNIDTFEKTNNMYERVMGISDLMLKKDQMARSTFEAGLTVAMAGTAAVVGVATGGTGLSVIAAMTVSKGAVYTGLALGGGYAISQFIPGVAEAQEEFIQNAEWLTESDFNKWVTRNLNANQLEQMNQIIREEKSYTAKNRQRVAQMSDYEFDQAVSYGLQHSGTRDKGILTFIQAAREMGAREDFEEYAAQWEEKKRIMDENIKAGKTDDITALDQFEIAEKCAMIQAVRTGNYFHFAMTMDSLKNAMEGTGLEEERQAHLGYLNPTELALLNKTIEAITESNATAMEAENRDLLIKEWANAGRPIDKSIADKNQTNTTAQNTNNQQPAENGSINNVPQDSPNFDFLDDFLDNTNQPSGENGTQQSPGYDFLDAFTDNRNQTNKRLEQASELAYNDNETKDSSTLQRIALTYNHTENDTTLNNHSSTHTI